MTLRAGGDPVSTPERIPDVAIERIARDLRAGRPGALGALYDLVASRAFGLALRILGDRDAAEDAVQDAFEQVWQQRDRVDPDRGRLDALTLTIVRRRALDLARARSRRVRRAAPLAEEFDVADESIVDAADLLASGLDAARVRTALDALPAAQRQVIDLAYFGGRTMAEVASELDIAVGTAKSRARLALQRLRDAMIGVRDDE